MEYRFASASMTVLALLLAASVAQATEKQDPKKLAAQVEKWLGSEHNDGELLGATVGAVLADHKRGIALLADLLKAARAKPQLPRSRGTQALALRVSLGFLQRETAGNVIFAGQYDPLLPLQPFVGDLFFSWLVDTPSWFPDTHRIHLVPALRDLQPTLPGTTELEAVLAIIENEAIEPENLRFALACMLWQWGKKEHVQPRIDKLVKDSAEGSTEDRVFAFLELADLYYALRDYRTSAATHRSLQRLAKDTTFELKPLDWYSAACVHALSGEIEDGIAALAKCADLQASSDVDSSHKVEREVFETDPEIGALRTHPKFKAIFDKAIKGRSADEAAPWKKKR